MIHATIDGIETQVPQGSTILEAARTVGIKIPTLCWHPDQAVKANCRICVCEVEGFRNLPAACSTPVSEGMVVRTRTPRVIQARRTILELILASHPQDCLNCSRSGNCELQDLAAVYTPAPPRFAPNHRRLPVDMSTSAMVRDPNKCILCCRCLETCSTTQSVFALGLAHRGFETMVVPTMGKPLADSPCVLCGQCIHACPVGAIYERQQLDDLLRAIADPQRVVVTQIAPAVRVALSEEWEGPAGHLSMESLVASLRQAGFDYVLHTNFTADLTVMEEGTELLARLEEKGPLPMITSCSPGWINFCETFYPDLLPHLSTCKSPQQMFGALVKTYWAEKMKIDPAQIYSVSIMPCTAKKHEASRPEMNASGYRDVDLVLTTREIRRLFKMSCIDGRDKAVSRFDSWMGTYSGAGAIFGATGGVMEAALRTVYELSTGHEWEELTFSAVRGMQEIKEAEIDLNGTAIRVAVAHGLSNARLLMDQVRAGRSPYHFIEIMACPGGCIGGGGQPLTKTTAHRAERLEALYREDEWSAVRKSHENPDVQRLYEDYLQEPLGHRCHDLLHTHYQPRERQFL